MFKFIYNLRNVDKHLDKITDVEVDGINTRDYPDFCDAYISSASWKGTSYMLTDKQLDDLNENGDFVYNEVIYKVF